jgi:hypothetical protein
MLANKKFVFWLKVCLFAKACRLAEPGALALACSGQNI